MSATNILFSAIERPINPVQAMASSNQRSRNLAYPHQNRVFLNLKKMHSILLTIVFWFLFFYFDHNLVYIVLLMFYLLEFF